MTRTSLKWSALAALAFTFLFLGCPNGNNTFASLSVSANPRAIDDMGQMSTISVDAVDEKGLPGTGAVTLSTPAGQLGAMSVTLDKNGHGTATFTCQKSADANCKNTVKITASWMSPKSGAINGFVNIQVGPQPVNDSGMQDAGGGAGGGSGGGGGSVADAGLVLTSEKPEIFTGVGDTSIITATVVQNGQPVTNSQVDFTTTLGQLTPSGGTAGTSASAMTDATGAASVVLSEQGTPGTATITATNTMTGFTGSIGVPILKVQQITWVSTKCNGTDCTVMGAIGSGYNTVSTVTFHVADNLNAPIPNLTVQFTINQPPSGTTLTASAATDAAGNVSTSVKSGTSIGSFAVHAVAAPGVSVDSPTIGIIGAKATNEAFVFQCVQSNIDAYNAVNPPAVRSTQCTVSLRDRYTNPVVTPGTAVNLKTEAGTVPGNVNIDTTGLTAGQGTFTFSTTGTFPALDVPPLAADATQIYPGARSAEINYVTGGLTRNPRDGLVTLLAYVQGEEFFSDSNTNGIRDALPDGGMEPFIDQGEPFVDANDNGVQDGTEYYFDSNNNHVWDGPNGMWDDTATVWADVTILYTNHTDSSLSHTIPATYGTCGSGVPKGGFVDLAVFAPDLNMNRIIINSAEGVVHTALTGSVAIINPGILDGYGFHNERAKVNAAGNQCNFTTDAVCTWKRLFQDWGDGQIPSVRVTGDGATSMTPCNPDTATITTTVNGTSVSFNVSGAIQ